MRALPYSRLTLAVFLAGLLGLTVPSAHAKTDSDDEDCGRWISNREDWPEKIQNLAEKLPKNLTTTERLLALSLLQSDSTGLPFMNEVCRSFDSPTRLRYLLLLTTHKIHGDKLGAFYLAIKSDIRLGYRLLETNDPVLAEFENK